MAVNVTNCSTENTDIRLPSHVDIVDGLDDRIQSKIDVFNNTTLATKISALSNTYLGKTANAVSATKATNDGDGNKISTTYYKKSDKVSSAANADFATEAERDHNGNVIIDTYVTKTDVINNAQNAVAATFATYDSENANTRNAIRDYFIGVQATNNNHGITFTRGTGQTTTISIADTTYQNATATNAGLMSADDKTALTRLVGPTHIYPANDFGGDFNNINVSGFFTVRDIASWNHRPAGTSTASHALLVFKVNAGGVQLLFDQQHTNFYQRTYLGQTDTAAGYWTSWSKVTGTAVDTIEN